MADLTLADLSHKLLLTVPEAMALTGVGEDAIREAIRSGALTAKTTGAGRNHHILPGDLKAWVENLPSVADRPRVLQTQPRRRA